MQLAKFENLFSSTILSRGRQYYNAGRVEHLEEEGSPGSGNWYAQVMGSTGNYSVEIHLNEKGGVKSWSCECPYGNGCKHQAAVLFKIKEAALRTIVNIIKETKVKKPTIEQALATYATLSESEQRIVKIAAMAYEPASQTKLIEIFNQCNFKHNGVNLYPKDIHPILNKLNVEGLLTTSAGSQYECPRPIADAICNRYAATDPDFKKTIIPIQRAFPIYANWYGGNDTRRQFREMRIGRYMDDISIFERGFKGALMVVNYNKREYDQESLTEHWLGSTFDLAVLQSFGRRIRAFLLAKRLTLDLFELNSLNSGFFMYTLDQIEEMNEKDKPMLANILAQFCILKGDWNSINKLSKHLGEINLGVYAAIKYLLQGSNEPALDTFDLTQKALRKHTGNTKEVLQGLPGAFQIFSYLKAQDPKFYKKTNTHAKQATTPGYTKIYGYLMAVVAFLENNKPYAEQLLKDKPGSELDTFFHFLCQFLVSEGMVNHKKVAEYRSILLENGYTWMAAEMNALLGELGQPTDGCPLPEGEPLCQVLPRIEEWENALKMLLGLGGKAAAVAESTDRIAWLVNFEKGHIQARHQTITKTGWGKGKAVAFTRLKSGEVPGLSPQDIQFVKAVAYAWGSEIEIRGDESKWKHLVGHPLLFLEKSPDTAVQLVEAKPTLIAKRTNKGYQLQFSHDIFTAGAKVVKETPTRYQYIETTEQVAMIARSFNGKALTVPEKGETQLREALSGLSHLVQVQSAFEDENLPTVKADSRSCVHLLSVGNGFHVEVYAKPFRTAPPYVKPGDGEPYLIGSLNGERTATTRDLKMETKNLASLREKVPILKHNRPSGGTWNLEDTETCLQLLLELRPLIEAEEVLLEWPKGEKFKVSQVVGFDEFRMSVSDGGGHWFEVEGELRVDEDKVLTLQELLALSNQQSPFVEVSPGKFLALTEEFRRRLQGINGVLAAQKKGGKLVLHPLAAPAIDGFTGALRNFESSKKFQESKAKLEAAFAKKFKLPKDFNAELRPYQLTGFKWLHRCAEWGVGACLADDMGLGKTVQALAFLTDRAKLGPALVAAPASVCRNWMNEAARFAPALTPILFSESDRAATIKNAKKGDIVVVTYDLMTREEKLFTEKKWATVILDEAQAIKNRATKRSDTVMQLQADFRMAMTGTPIENHLGELWNLFNFLNPGLLGSIEQFAERFSGPIERYGDDNRREQLRRLVQPFILRRKKDEVLKDLPEKTEITLTVELPPAERAFYEALRRNALEKLAETAEEGQAGQQHLRILAEIMKLRRAACHPSLADANAGFTQGAKLELFGQVVDELLENGHKALVFSQFVDHLRILENHLKSKKIPYQYLDGSTPGKKRQAAIDAFQAGEGDIFLISLKAGGTGLNLTAADFVIHTDPWWNPAVEDQATDRAHRIGQERPVTVYRLVAEQTIEEKILQLHTQKRDLADSLLAGADVSAKLSADDLMKLLRTV
ncbi:MAG: DEAD/DEAH box helicase [Saprospiraceae bacterium]|nr:DEAD/DEAH box helicase [Saprospiraceae bacterium]